MDVRARAGGGATTVVGVRADSARRKSGDAGMTGGAPSCVGGASSARCWPFFPRPVTGGTSCSRTRPHEQLGPVTLAMDSPHGPLTRSRYNSSSPSYSWTTAPWIVLMRLPAASSTSHTRSFSPITSTSSS